MIVQLRGLILSVLRGLLNFYWYIVVRITFILRGIEGVNLMLLNSLPNNVQRILRLCHATVGGQVSLYSPLMIVNANPDYSHLTIGNGVHIGRGVLIDLHQHVTIEDCATVSMGARIVTHQHVGNSPLRELGYPYCSKSVVIERGAYIGVNAVILQGTRIGECSVIGGGAIVNRDIPPYSVAVGVPARVIKHIAHSQKSDALDGKEIRS